MKQVEYYKNGNRTLRIKYVGIKKLLEKQSKEIERLHSIIKEVREGIIKYKEILETGAENNVFYIYLDSPIQKLEKFLEILDKDSDKE